MSKYNILNSELQSVCVSGGKGGRGQSNLLFITIQFLTPPVVSFHLKTCRCPRPVA